MYTMYKYLKKDALCYLQPVVSQVEYFNQEQNLELELWLLCKYVHIFSEMYSLSGNKQLPNTNGIRANDVETHYTWPN